MKNSLKYSDLWRKKREELPLDAEPQAGWLEMQSLLDLHLPVTPASPATPVSKLAKLIKAIKAMKATSLLIASFAIATVTGTAIYLLKKQQAENSSRQHKNNIHAMRRDSLSDSSKANALKINHSSETLSDTLQDSDLYRDKQQAIADNNDSLDAVKTSTGLSNNNIKATNTGSSSSVNNRQNASGKYAANGTSTNSFLLGSHSGKNRNQTTGKHANNTHYNTTDSTASSQLTGNDYDSVPESNTADNQQKQNNNPLIITLTSSYSGIQSKSSTGLNTALFQPGIFAGQPPSGFMVGNYYLNRLRNVVNNKTPNNKNQTNKNQSVKSGKAKGAGSSLGRSLSSAFANTDFGILLGANTGGSFTTGTQNHNFYGSSPVDFYAGLFTTYNINNSWAVNLQARFLTPLSLSGTYTNQNDHVDSARSLRVTDSRKAYFVTIPIHAVYKINSHISIKGGPVMNILAKQIGFNTSAQKIFPNVDTLFLQSRDSLVKTSTRYNQKINFGLSGGVSVQLNRFIIEVLYQKSFGGYNVISDFHNYKNNPGSLQISIGFKLNNSKHH